MISVGSDCVLLVPVEAEAVIPLWWYNEVKYILRVTQIYHVNCLGTSFHFITISVNWHILFLFLTRQNVCGLHT